MFNQIKNGLPTWISFNSFEQYASRSDSCPCKYSEFFLFADTCLHSAFHQMRSIPVLLHKLSNVQLNFQSFARHFKFICDLEIFRYLNWTVSSFYFIFPLSSWQWQISALLFCQIHCTCSKNTHTYISKKSFIILFLDGFIYTP